MSDETADKAIGALKEAVDEIHGLRTKHQQFVAFHEAFAEECSKKIEAAERTIEQLRAELAYERKK